MSAKSCVIPRIMCKWEFIQPPEELIKREVSGCSHDFAHSLQAAPGGWRGNSYHMNLGPSVSKHIAGVLTLLGRQLSLLNPCQKASEHSELGDYWSCRVSSAAVELTYIFHVSPWSPLSMLPHLAMSFLCSVPQALQSLGSGLQLTASEVSVADSRSWGHDCS